VLLGLFLVYSGDVLKWWFGAKVAAVVGTGHCCWMMEFVCDCRIATEFRISIGVAIFIISIIVCAMVAQRWTLVFV